MQKLELQVLTGLHAGARHPVSLMAFTLGGGGEADLRLLDDEFDGVTISFRQLESGSFLVEATVPLDICDQVGRRLPQADSLSPQQFVRIGSVWITLQIPGAPLAAVPSLVESPVESPVMADETKSEDDFAGPESATGLDSSSAISGREASGHQRLRRKAAAGLIGGVMAILLVGLGFAWAPSEAHVPEAGNTAAVRSGATGPTGAPVAGVTRDQQARNLVKTLLEQHGINQAVTVRVGLGEATFSGKLDRQQIELFDRAITEIQTQVGSDFRISANIETLHPAPEFRIREVVSGKHGWIVTDSGQRVIIGGEIEGYRLTSIDGSKIVLIGPDRIEIQL